MPSFDVVSKVDWAEIQNAVNQAGQEVGQRFDFRGTDTTIEKSEQTLVVASASEERAKAALDVLQSKMVRRKVSLKFLDPGEPEPGPKGSSKIVVQVKEGIDKDHAKDLVKRVKDSKLKVQASIQQDTVRVTGKKKDDLQSVISLLKGIELDIELQFVNFRD